MQDNSGGIRISGRPVKAPKPKHPVAVLRHMIGKTQEEFAGLIGYSAPTIESIEVGRLNLSEKLAQRISEKTGVNVGWLLRGNPQAHMIDQQGNPYTTQTFVEHALGEIPLPPLGEQIRILAVEQAGHLASIILSAYDRGNYQLCMYKIQEALDELERQFGRKEEVDQATIQMLLNCVATGTVKAGQEVDHLLRKSTCEEKKRRPHPQQRVACLATK